MEPWIPSFLGTEMEDHPIDSSPSEVNI